MTGNPYEPPAGELRRPPARPGSLTKAVALGLLADIGGTLLAGMLLGAIYAFQLAASGMSPEDVSEAVANASPSSWFSMAGYVLGCGCSVLGGYVCERVGRRGYRPGWVMWAVATVLIVPLVWAEQSPGLHVLEAAGALLSILAGIRLARRRHPAPVSPVGQAESL